MNMIRHHDECAEPHSWEMTGNTGPAIAGDFAKLTQDHFARSYSAE